jgi:hypothetical protein
MLSGLLSSLHVEAFPITETQDMKTLGHSLTALQDEFLKPRQLFEQSGPTKRSASLEIVEEKKAKKIRSRHEKPNQRVVKILRQYVRV